MTKEYFEELLTEHGDIMLKVLDYEFTILTFDNFSVGIYDDIYDYDTVEEVLDNYKIKGIPLKDLLDDLELIDCS